jgi:hypothetical protein
MDASATPGRTSSIVLEITRAPNGRLEGRLGAGTTGPQKPFSGVLELLKALEETLDAAQSVAPITQSNERTES